MQAGIFAQEGVLEVGARPEPSLADVAPDWVKLEIEACGICGTDLQILNVPPGYPAPPDTVLGHEFAGRIAEAGPAVAHFRAGDRVTVAPNLTCHELNRPLCRQCRLGRPNHCANWTTIGIHRDGGFARFLLAPEKALFRVAEDLPVANAIWIEPLSCVLGGYNRFDISSEALGVVIGAGPIGILHGMLLKATGVRVLISDLSPFRLAKARRAGLDVTVDARTEDLGAAVKEASEQQGADLVVDAVGGQLDAAVECAGMMGQICCFGINAARPTVNQYLVTERELTIFGTYVGVNTFPQAIEILETGTLNPSVLNHAFLPLSELAAGFDVCRKGEAVKVAVTPA